MRAEAPITLRPDELQRLLESAALSVQDAPRFSDNGKANDNGSGGTSRKDRPMQRVHGPYQHHKKWRVTVIDTETREQTHHGFSSQAEAILGIVKLRRTTERQNGATFTDTVQTYRAHLVQKGNRPRTIETTIYRIGLFFRPWIKPLAMLGDRDAGDLFEALPGAVDSRLNVLNQSRTFMKWAASEKIVGRNPLAELRPGGKRRKGKAQLRIDEARRWLAEALTQGEKDPRALAAAFSLLLGLRASEISARIVRDVDDGCRLLWIPEAKTDRGVRRLNVPEVLRPPLRLLTAERKPDEPLFGNISRHIVRNTVKKICLAVGVPVVTAHGMRGLHATLAVGAGVSGDAVAASLGHSSFEGVTVQHYAEPAAVAAAKQDRSLAALGVA